MRQPATTPRLQTVSSNVKGRPKRQLPVVAARLGEPPPPRLRPHCSIRLLCPASSCKRQRLGRPDKLALPSNKTLLSLQESPPDMLLGTVRDTCQCKPAAPEPRPPAASPMVLPTAKP